MEKLNLKEGTFPIIIKPNLGQPVILNLRDFKSDDDQNVKNIFFDAIIITISSQPIEEILQFFRQKVFIQPILNDEGEFSKRRGDKYQIQVIDIQKIEKTNFKDQAVLQEENCITWDLHKRLLKINDVFGERKILFRIRFEISNIEAIEQLLKTNGRTFLLFDLIHILSNNNEIKINYHSVAIFDKDWSNFKFIHSTDFHVAARNDYIIKFLKDKTNDKLRRYQHNQKKLETINTFILKRDFKFKEELQENRFEELKVAKFNFNYSLRKLIDYINDKVLKNELDFVLMTGDLVDYIEIARGNFQYKNNFFVFLDILLGVNKGVGKPPYIFDDELINKKEILAPIFTTVGNHDYRKGHYSLHVGGISKIFGLTRKDIKGYYDLKFSNYFNALHSKNRFIKDYLRFFNPNLNYMVKFGDLYNFIFLDTGEDSVADMHDLLKGAPSTIGLKEYQIHLLRAYIQLSQDEKIIIVMHTPPVSPNLGFLNRRKFKRKFHVVHQLQWSDFYEDNLKKIYGNARLDKIVNLKYQTIMYNWATFLKICTGSDKVIRRKIDLILCGHTHALREFRLKEAREHENINLGFYIAPIPINVPCEVYTNNYRAFFKKFKDPKEFKVWFDVNKPFIFQTQAIGPISLGVKFVPPGFRYFKIQENQITEANIFSLHLNDF